MTTTQNLIPADVQVRVNHARWNHGTGVTHGPGYVSPTTGNQFVNVALDDGGFVTGLDARLVEVVGYPFYAIVVRDGGFDGDLVTSVNCAHVQAEAERIYGALLERFPGKFVQVSTHYDATPFGTA